MSTRRSKFQGLFGDGQPEAETSSPHQAEPSVAPTVPEEILESRNEETKKERKQDNGAPTLTRVKTNYEIREDYVRAFKVMAADERRKIYQLLEEAMKDFLVKRGKIPPE